MTGGPGVPARPVWSAWARAVAAAEGVPFIDLHEFIAQRYHAMGPEKVNPFFADEHTHTSAAGTEFNDECVVAGLKQTPNNPLAPWLRERGLTDEAALATAPRHRHLSAMVLEAAIRTISQARDAMHSSYGADVFDEWAILRLTGPAWGVAWYAGPRPDVFRRQLPSDLMQLAETASRRSHAIGDFEFAAQAQGTSHDGMMRIGGAAFLVCNNTTSTMAAIRLNPRWLEAQKTFAALGQAFVVDPIAFAA